MVGAYHPNGSADETTGWRGPTTRMGRQTRRRDGGAYHPNGSADETTGWRGAYHPMGPQTGSRTAGRVVTALAPDGYWKLMTPRMLVPAYMSS